MEIKVTNTAPGEYDTNVSFSGSVDDVIKETVVLLNAIGDSMAKHSKSSTVKRYYLLTVTKWLAEYLEKEVKKFEKHKKG